jgi:arabinan endo-1,5-alpha-L-arabinosidase
MLYHGVSVKNPHGRCLLLDQILWEDGWPRVQNSAPSLEATAPAFSGA